jgi:hypothetical protein
VVPETANGIPILLDLAAFIFILILDGNRWIAQKVQLCAICAKPAHTESPEQQ